jgi:hypothetical protein
MAMDVFRPPTTGGAFPIETLVETSSPKANGIAAAHKTEAMKIIVNANTGFPITSISASEQS